METTEEAAGRTARLVRKDGALVATSDTVVDDELVASIVDALRS